MHGWAHLHSQVSRDGGASYSLLTTLTRTALSNKFSAVAICGNNTLWIVGSSTTDTLYGGTFFSTDQV